jgi:hypothetical protein
MSALDFRGTWKLDPTRSNIPPITKSQILTIDTDGLYVTMREELVNDKDETLVISLTGRFDGKDNSVEGTPFADTVSYRLLAPRVIEGVAKKDGHMCVKETAVLSDSGNSVSVTYLSFDGVGKIVEHFGYFERVSEHG